VRDPVITPDNWRKSSYSGGGQGDACMEIADRRTHIAVRDTKAPTRTTLSITTPAFAAFVNALKTAGDHPG
jgi:hypothetical protein